MTKTDDGGPASIFSPDQVLNLARHQTGEGQGVFNRMHPFTCPNRGDGKHRDAYGDLGALVPTVRGWICPFCDYTQDWAHGFMMLPALPALQGVLNTPIPAPPESPPPTPPDLIGRADT